MALITLISDLGTTDFYLGALKGAIYRHSPDANLVDISHSIPPYDLERAAYMVRNACKEFPKGTIHIVAVDGQCDKGYLLVQRKGHTFLAPNNGVMSLVLGELPETTYLLDEAIIGQRNTFEYKNVFARTIMLLEQGHDVEEFASKAAEKLSIQQFKPQVRHNTITGRVIHIDNYNNLIVNIERKVFNDVVRDKGFKVQLRNHEIDRMVEHYGDTELGDELCLFNSSGLLEIGINQGEFAEVYNIKVGAPVMISVG